MPASLHNSRPTTRPLLAERINTQQERLPDTGMHLAQGFDLQRGGYQYWVTGQDAPAPFAQFSTPEAAVDHALCLLKAVP